MLAVDRRSPRIQVTLTQVGQPSDLRLVRIPPSFMASTLLLSLLVALPSFDIDMSLPAAHGHGCRVEWDGRSGSARPSDQR
jgi:hypothetical protein